jgi:formylglycine-generating enzyme required for sulfatase activity
MNIHSDKQKKFLQAQFNKPLDMNFVYIDAGTFMMGSPEDEAGRYDDEILHKVILSNDFYMQNTPVTVRQWRAFTEATNYKTQAEKEGGSYVWEDHERQTDPNIYWDNPGFEQTDNHPVTCVTWHDAQAFIQWLNEEGKEIYRLPTEAEWEYACRAGTTTPFSTGNCLPSEYANYHGQYSPLPGCQEEKYRNKLLAVASLKPNPWGLYDMHGNVFEWCQDQCEWDAEQSMIVNNTTYIDSIKDPLGQAGDSRILRGSCWQGDARHCRSTARLTHNPNDRFDYIGFRLVMDSSSAK